MKVTTNQNIVTINIQKILLNLTQGSLFRTREGKPPQKDLEDQSKSQEILIPASEISLKHTPQNFYGGKIAEDIQERHSVASDIVILQMVRGDIIEFERK